jgi:hypothetical protein
MGRAAVDRHVARLVRHAEVQPLTSLRFDVGRIIPALPLGLQLDNPSLLLVNLMAESIDLGPLDEILPERVGHRQTEDRQRDGENRGSAGECGPSGSPLPGAELGWRFGTARRSGTHWQYASGRRPCHAAPVGTAPAGHGAS